MSRTNFGKTRLLARLGGPLLLASALGACSSMPDWVDPTGWFGSDSQASSDQSGATTADATQPDSGKTPDLASVPAKPAAPSTSDEQQQVADALVADRAQAQYSAENLQGGNEPVAAPPAPDAVPAPGSSPAAAAVPQAPAAASGSSNDAAAAPAESSAPTAATAEAAPQPADTGNTAATQVASTESPASAAPAAAPMAAATSTAGTPATETQTGFAQSHAPALDPSVAQYVPQRILSRYQATAAAAAVPGVEGMSRATPSPAHRRKAKAVQTDAGTNTAAPAQ